MISTLTREIGDKLHDDLPDRGRERLLNDSSKEIANLELYRSARVAVPLSSSIIQAFTDARSGDHPGQVVLDLARELAIQHQRQWLAEDVSRDPGAVVEAVAASKWLIDNLNARRVAFVEQLDAWVAQNIHGPADASLHTESLGSVVDRLAIAWVRVKRLSDAGGVRDRANIAMRQLAELADAYDDLIRDLAAGRRRLPAWRPLKAYGVRHDPHR
jgi:hypothetical protein